MKIEANAQVAFQGERGAFSEEAALKLVGGEIQLVPCATFAAAFRAVPMGDADYVLAPVENSLAGAVQWSLDLLAESELGICAEVILPIVHNLIGVPGARIEQIRSVESHPVALAQCERFFRANPGIKRIAAEDTAGSVREIVNAGDPARAAVAGRRNYMGGKFCASTWKTTLQISLDFFCLRRPREQRAQERNFRLYFSFHTCPERSTRPWNPSRGARSICYGSRVGRCRGGHGNTGFISICKHLWAIWQYWRP